MNARLNVGCRILAIGLLGVAVGCAGADSPPASAGAVAAATQLESERVGPVRIQQPLDSALLEGVVIADAVRALPIGGDSARIVTLVLRADTLELLVHNERVGSITTRSPHVRSAAGLGVGTEANVFSREVLREAVVIHGDLFISPANLCGIAFVVPGVGGETGDAISTTELASLPSSARVVEIVVDRCV